MISRRQAGFTLVELILVIVLAGILAAVGAPSLVNNQAQDQLTTRDELKATLRYARQVALSQNRTVCVMRNAIEFRLVYAPAVGPCNAAGIPVLEAGSGQPKVVGLDKTGVTIAGPVVLMFNSRGQLTAPTPVVTYTVGPTMVLNVNRETGFVSYQ